MSIHHYSMSKLINSWRDLFNKTISRVYNLVLEKLQLSVILPESLN